MDEKALVKICKLVLKKDKKKKKPKRKTIVKRIPFEDPTTRGAFPIAGRSGLGTYGRPYGFTPAFGSGTTIIAQDRPLEITKKPPVKFVGELTPEEERKFKEDIEEIIEKPKKITFQEPKSKPKVKQPDMDTEDLFTEDDDDDDDIFIESYGFNPPLIEERQRTEILQPLRFQDIMTEPRREVLERSRMRKEDK